MTTPASATFITRGTSSVRRILAIASGVLLLTASLAHAQRATERGYLVGGISVDHQSGATGEVQELYITAPGGWTTGWTLGAGVHAGEVEVRGTDVAGMAVHIGARVAALAGASEVLVSSTIREIVTGSRRMFEERGEHELKGVPGQWRIYALVRD